MKTIESNSHLIYFENSLQQLGDFIKNGQYSKIIFLVDTNTEEHCLPMVKNQLVDLADYDVIEIDPGEENKNIDFCIGIWKMLLDYKADRNSLLINLGGGVITDIGGFAASTFKRGIDFVNVPTTLLSQVDASVGGKTGIDMDQVKNIIGTFTQPKAVFINTAFLKTLNRKEVYSGFAEIIKHGLIYDAKLFKLLLNTKPERVSPEIIYRSVMIKNEVVTTDPFEKGLRKILNFGHTIGHAIESYSLLNDKQPLLHGEAIAIGFICESYLSTKYSTLSELELVEIKTYILSCFPTYKLKENSFKKLIEIMKNDKKNEADKIGFALLNQIGKCDYNYYLPETDIISSLKYYQEIV